MSKQITLLGRLPMHDPHGDVGLLFECAEDGKARTRFPHAFSLYDLVGHPDTVRREAFVLVPKLLDGEPLLRGIGQLGVFDEMLIFQFQALLHAKHLYDFIVANGYRVCILEGNSQLLRSLQWFVAKGGGKIELRLPSSDAVQSEVPVWQRVWERVKGRGYNRAAFAVEWRQVMDRLDPYHRCLCLRRRKRVQKRRIWFYSTAYTFSRIALAYEPYFPEAFEYLVENPYTGGEALTALGRPFSSPYDFVALAMAPSRNEVAEAQTTILQHLRSAHLSRKEALVRDAYLECSDFEKFMHRLLPRGLFQTALFERFVEQVRPRALVVGNAVFEGYALHAARKAGIRTILLQHGTLSEICQYVDPPVDHYIVRGSFWSSFVEAKQGSNVRTVNPGNSDVHTSVPSSQKRRSILFLTAPYSMHDDWDKSDLDDILITLLTAGFEFGAEVIIRVHPLECLGAYQMAVSELACKEVMKRNVVYSQGGVMDALLEKAAVAVTFSSTTFLDCLRFRVPVVSFDWHDFDYKQQIDNHGVFNFCRTLDELKTMVVRAVQGQLPAYMAATETFLASMSDDEVRARIGELVTGYGMGK